MNLHASFRESVVLSAAGALVLTASVVACGAGGGDLPGGGGKGNGSGNRSNGAGGSAGGIKGQGGAVLFGGNGGAGNTATTGGSGGTVDYQGKQHPSNIDECTAIDGATLSALQGGGAAGGMRWLYPYDGTVWPRGLLGPILQWEGGAADAVFVRLTSRDFSYQGCFGPSSAPHQLPLPQIAWEAAGEWSQGYGDPLNVELSVMSGGTVSTIRESWTFALAKIKGAIYYNTYTSPAANNNGAVLKLLPGQDAPTPFLTEAGAPPFGPCISCHSLSADGSTMTANRHFYPGVYESLSYDVTAAQANLLNGALPEAGFAGLYPDGSRLMTNGPPFASTSPLFPVAPGNVPALVGPAEAHLLDPATGQVVPSTGWTAVHAQMPMFSPNGRMIVYNDHDQGGGHSLWVADYDRATDTFSNAREIFNDPQLYPGWPFFTPDSTAIVFQLGTRSDFVSQLPNPVTVFPPDGTGFGHLRIVNVDQPGNAVPLDLANGWANGGSYLPHGDNDREFFPTVSPVAAGGYFWVFFTSRRKYGNITADVDVEMTESKKIWVTALSIGTPAGQDPSNPAFVLPGQEIESGNLRAFAALEPCKEDGQACESGTECCNGFCIDGICQPPQECANLDDKCETSDDCCNDSHRCLGGFCGVIIVR